MVSPTIDGKPYGAYFAYLYSQPSKNYSRPVVRPIKLAQNPSSLLFTNKTLLCRGPIGRQNVCDSYLIFCRRVVAGSFCASPFAHPSRYRDTTLCRLTFKPVLQWTQSAERRPQARENDDVVSGCKPVAAAAIRVAASWSKFILCGCDRCVRQSESCEI